MTVMTLEWIAALFRRVTLGCESLSGGRQRAQDDRFSIAKNLLSKKTEMGVFAKLVAHNP